MKTIFGRTYDNNQSSNDIIRIGVVINNDDTHGNGAIKVRIKGIHDKVDEIIVYPLLPKYLYALPKVGEAVLVIKSKLNDISFDSGYYIGPLISQLDNLSGENYFFSGKNSTNLDHPKLLDIPVNDIPESDGIYPQKDDVSFLGRDNTDIIQRKNEIIIRAGKYKDNNPILFNNENPSYIQLKYSVLNDIKTSSINIVANKINLITYDGIKRFNVSKQPDYLLDDELKKIFETAESIPYGNILVEFLTIMRNYILNHVHPYNGMKPVASIDLTNDFVNFNLENIKSKNIKIN